ncbi:MAG: ABC transporter permease [Alicyclobacillus sp.]|nr:ABC transporter permease [Alicyclobacillus sp.]
MLTYLAKRLFYMIMAFLVVSIVTFILMKSAPGTFLVNTQMMGGIQAATDLNISPQLMDSFIKEFHLNQPWYVQYWFYLQSFVTLHLGFSIEYPSLPTMDLIKRTFPVTFGLSLAAVCVGTLISIVAGTIAAVRENSWADTGTMVVATLGTAIPNYIIAILLMLVFGVWWKVLPILGFKGIQYYILPTAALVIPMVGSMSKYMRNSLIESLHSDYIVAVYARGGSLRDVIFKHALRNSLLPLITVVGPQLAAMMMGTVLIENMFGIPGMGQIFAEASQRKDYPLIMDSALIYAVVIMMMNLIVDLVYGVLDPRIRKLGYLQGR